MARTSRAFSAVRVTFRSSFRRTGLVSSVEAVTVRSKAPLESSSVGMVLYYHIQNQCQPSFFIMKK